MVKTCTYKFISNNQTLYKSVQIDNETILTQWIEQGMPGFTKEPIRNIRDRIKYEHITIIEGDRKW